MKAVAGQLCSQLKSEHLDAGLSLQAVKNLFYIGKCFHAIPYVATVTAEPELDAGADDNDDAGDVDAEPQPKERYPLPWLFSKLSYQIRSAQIARRNQAFASVSSKPADTILTVSLTVCLSLLQKNWAEQPLAVLRWFAAMASHMEPVRLEGFLMHILSPVYRLIEEDTIRDSNMGTYSNSVLL